MKRNFIYILSALLFSGCITDKNFTGPNPGGDNLQATLTLRVAGGESVQSRALSAGNENEIEEIDVLVFKKAAGDTGDGTFDYLARTTLVEGTAGAATRTFQVTLRRSAGAGDLQKSVVLANAGAVVGALDLTQSMSYADVMALLVMERAAQWTTTGAFDPLPMWGESTFKAFTDPAAAGGQVDMYRALAAIDVNVTAPGFTLSEIRLHNPSRRGLLAPSGTWNGEAATPSEPDAGWNRATSAFSYPVTGNSSAREIYTFEAPAATGGASDTAPFLVVKGTYGGDEGYYRIDLRGKIKSSEASVRYLPLLRNFRYGVTITAVGARGYATEAEAIAASFTDMTVSTQVVNDGGMGNVKWDGRNYLALTTDAWDTDKGAKTISNIAVATNYSGGWSAEVDFDAADGANWISVPAGPQTNGSPLNIDVTATDKNRTAVITVSAGRLRQTLTITQLFNDRLALDVGDVEVIFPAKTTPAAFMLPVEWEPARENVSVEVINAGTPAAGAYPQLTGYTQGLVFTANPLPATLPDTDGNFNNGGMALLSIEPNADTGLAAFAERRSILKITSFDNGADEPLVKTVLLRQFDYRIVVTGMRTTYQPNTTYSLTVKSNGQWNVAADSGELTILSQTIDNDSNTGGVAVSFTTGSTIGAEPKLIFTQPEHGVTEEVEIAPIERMLPNCYIVHPEPGVNEVIIPIAKVFEVWDNDRDLNGQRAGDASAMNPANTYTAELLWQDEIDLIPDNPSSIVVEKPGSDYTTARIKVTVNSTGKEGNAVVVLKENGTIRWSWHVWVLGSANDPTDPLNYKTSGTHTLMDRNLGATTNFAPENDNDARSFGLLYQWGKNIPFPGARTTRSTTTNSKYIYALGGTDPLTEEVITDPPGSGVVRMETPVARNLAGALMNPLTFYTGVTTPGTSQNDWYANAAGSTNENHRNDFWAVYKTWYDPCPDGWRVPERDFLYTVMPTAWTDYRGMDLGAAGFAPAGCYRGSRDGTLYVSGRGFWGATAGLNGIGSLCTYGVNYINAGNSIQNASGYSVRCVKIE